LRAAAAVSSIDSQNYSTCLLFVSVLEAFSFYDAIVRMMRLGMAKGTLVSGQSERAIHRESRQTVASVAETPLDGMMAEERRMQILQTVRSTGRVRVNELASHFSTSAVTIRNDLNELHQRGLVQRSHGGAVLPDTILRESPVNERLKAHSEEKRRIGAMAASLIKDGETIILDSGTTTLEIARQIKRRQRLQIITNGVNIAAELLDAQGKRILIAICAKGLA
jgi:predicted transcriptional regulator